MNMLTRLLERVLGAADRELPAAVELGWRAGVGAPDSPMRATSVVPEMQRQMEQGASGARDDQFTSILEATRTVGDSGRRLVNVGAVLDAQRERLGPALDWRRSVGDLLLLAGLDGSLEARRQLARELGGPGDSADIAALDAWLLPAVMKEFAAHGGEVPQDLLSG
jgi:hypothetical protein